MKTTSKPLKRIKVPSLPKADPRWKPMNGSDIEDMLLAEGFKRADAARFSFLMSIPIIFGAGLLKIKHFHDGVTTPELSVGFITAAVFGFLSIKFLLQLLAKKDFTLFVWYRIAFAVLIVAVYFTRR